MPDLSTTPQAGAQTAEANYDPEFYSALFAAEDRHFWFRSRNRCISAALRSLPDFGSIRDVIEVGCGTGVVLAELQRLFPAGRVMGMDMFAEGLVYARQRFAGTLIHGDVFQHTFEHPFDLLAACDVIEHLDDDERILRQFWRQLRPGGKLLVTVPAHTCLWSYFDEAAHHRRRYSPRELRSKLVSAGFSVFHLTQFMSFLFPLMWIKRVAMNEKRVTATTQNSATISDLAVPPIINAVLEFALRPEAAFVAKRISIPLGTSLLAIATKPRSDSR